MDLRNLDGPAGATLHLSDLTPVLDAMPPHDVRVIAGLDVPALAEHLAVAPPRRPVLLMDLGSDDTTAVLVRAAVAQLADAVSALWPFMWDGEDFSELRDDALGHAHLPIRLARLAARVPLLSRAWAQEAIPRLLRKRAPRARDCAPEVEWRQLALAFAPAGLIIAVPFDVSSAGPAWISAVEWLARHADVAVLVLAETMPRGRDFERILYGARLLLRPPEQPFPPPSETIGPREPAEQATTLGPRVIALPDAEGRPHPQSFVELKLYKLIQNDADLRPLFAFNRFVPDLPLLQAKADLIWADGRLVVEIDGPEHRAAAKYRADRHRDYELVRAGYRVLRMTNEDILADAALALEKIRDLVRLAQAEAR